MGTGQVGRDGEKEDCDADEKNNHHLKISETNGRPSRERQTDRDGYVGHANTATAVAGFHFILSTGLQDP